MDTFAFLNCSLGLQQLVKAGKDPEEPFPWHSLVFSSQTGYKVLEFCSPLTKAQVQCAFWRVFSANYHHCFASLVVEGSADVTGLTVLPPVYADACLRGESVLCKQVQASAKMNIGFY